MRRRTHGERTPLNADINVVSLIDVILLLLVINFIGLGFGPTYVGAASDWFRPTHPEHSLQMALYTLTPFFVVASVLFLLLARVLRREQRATLEAFA